MAFDLNGKSALVTGAGQDAGLGISHGLSVQGARVLVRELSSRLERLNHSA